jgi:hypothetical protein
MNAIIEPLKITDFKSLVNLNVKIETPENNSMKLNAPNK